MTYREDESRIPGSLMMDKTTYGKPWFFAYTSSRGELEKATDIVRQIPVEITLNYPFHNAFKTEQEAWRYAEEYIRAELERDQKILDAFPKGTHQSWLDDREERSKRGAEGVGNP